MIEPFFFIFLRLLAFLLSWPLFDKLKVSFFMKLLMALGLSAVLFPLLKGSLVPVSEVSFFWISFRELFIGFSLGFLSRIFFMVAYISGNFIQSTFFQYEMEEEGIFSDFHALLITVLFLSLNGHFAFVSDFTNSLIEFSLHKMIQWLKVV